MRAIRADAQSLPGQVLLYLQLLREPEGDVCVDSARDGTEEAERVIGYEDSKRRFEDGEREFAVGNRRGFGKYLYARVFYPERCGPYEKKLDNEKLGLPKEDLDEFTKKGIELAESGYMKNYA